MTATAELILGLFAFFIICGALFEWYFDRAPFRDEDEELGDRPPLHFTGGRGW